MKKSKISDGAFDEWTFKHAMDQAKKNLLADGHLVPVIMGYTREGGMLIIPGSPDLSEENKAAWITVSKLAFLAYGVRSYVVLTEAWLAMQSPEDEKPYVRPSQDPSRVEVLIASAISDKRRRMEAFEIVRDGEPERGPVRELKHLKSYSQSGDALQGRLVELLPPVELRLDEDARQEMLLRLSDMGISLTLVPMDGKLQ